MFAGWYSFHLPVVCTHEPIPVANRNAEANKIAMWRRFLGGMYNEQMARPLKPKTNGQDHRIESDATFVNSSSWTTKRRKNVGFRGQK